MSATGHRILLMLSVLSTVLNTTQEGSCSKILNSTTKYAYIIINSHFRSKYWNFIRCLVAEKYFSHYYCDPLRTNISYFREPHTSRPFFTYRYSALYQSGNETIFGRSDYCTVNIDKVKIWSFFVLLLERSEYNRISWNIQQCSLSINSLLLPQYF
jgi:hypothetical protein